MKGELFWQLVIIVVIGEYLVMARKIKRRGSFVPTGAYNKPRSAIIAEPYKYETVHFEEFSQPQQQQLHYGYEDAHQHQTVSSSYIIDNGLRNIAKGSANQASSAVASQNAAAKQAAYVAKNSLAQAASQAAGTAVAVLKGKEAFLQKLEEHHAEAHKTLQNELIQLQQAKRSAKAAQLSTEQALNHVSILTAALNNAQSASQLAEKSASEAAAELASQIDMVAEAKSKLEQLETQLYGARLDFEETKEAAEKATNSAQQAQNNANDAGVHANIELNDSVSTSLHAVQADPSSDPYHHEIVVKRDNANNNKINI